MFRLAVWAVFFSQILPGQVFAPGAKLQDHGEVQAREGPAWDGSTLYFTGRNRISQRDSSGKVSAFREPSGGANGIVFDREGRMLVCEAGNRRVTRTEKNGSLTVLADSYGGHKFNSPNDLTIDSRGRIYFSDPRYGPRDTMEMKDAQGRLVEGVYRIDGPGKVTRILTHEVDRPNGLWVSGDDRFLYVADNNNNNQGAARKLWRFPLKSDGSVDAGARKLVFDWGTARGPDGLKADEKGRLYVAAGLNKPAPPHETADKYKGGIYVLSPEGELLQFLPVPTDEVTNCVFGGVDRKTLFITAGGHLYSIRTEVPGFRRF